MPPSHPPPPAPQTVRTRSVSSPLSFTGSSRCLLACPCSWRLHHWKNHQCLVARGYISRVNAALDNLPMLPTGTQPAALQDFSSWDHATPWKTWTDWNSKDSMETHLWRIRSHRPSAVVKAHPVFHQCFFPKIIPSTVHRTALVNMSSSQEARQKHKTNIWIHGI
jgi:hypothetical protein